MLTPAFELNQDDVFVYVYIKTPYIKVQDVDYVIDHHLFKFFVKPYFLRLNFPEELVENGKESASYDIDKGLFTICLPKLVKGRNFPDLDLVTKLLAPTGKSSTLSPGIEVIRGETESDCSDEEDWEWEWKQELPDEKSEHYLGMTACKYGFGNQKSGVFSPLKDELKDIVEVVNPDEMTFNERRVARIAAEDVKFDEEHYLADTFDDEIICEILKYKPSTNESFTEVEKKKLRTLPNREYILDSNEKTGVFYGLLDIMFAYAYNRRTTLGENTVESAWTISKLSATLSWFERFTCLDEVLMACARRSLCYPLYRHWNLTCKVLQDVKHMFQIGRRMILKCLLEVLMLFNESEPRYLLNELYIIDYCVWIQKVKEGKIYSFAKKLSKMELCRDSVGWNLVDLEAAGILALNEREYSHSDSSDSETSSDDSNSETESNKTIESCSSTEDEKQSFIENGATKNAYDVLSNITANLSLKDENDDDLDETVTNVEILPSLLFSDQNSQGKKCIEILYTGSSDETR